MVFTASWTPETLFYLISLKGQVNKCQHLAHFGLSMYCLFAKSFWYFDGGCIPNAAGLHQRRPDTTFHTADFYFLFLLCSLLGGHSHHFTRGSISSSWPTAVSSLSILQQLTLPTLLFSPTQQLQEGCNRFEGDCVAVACCCKHSVSSMQIWVWTLPY